MFEVFPRAEYEAKRLRCCCKLIRKSLGGCIPFLFSSRLRLLFLKICGVKTGKGVFIGRNCIIDDNFPELITIEDNVTISAGTIIFAHDASTPEGAVSRVLIKNKAYLGAGSIILPGVTIGEAAVVGAGAVVSKDVAAGTVVVGVPARPIERHSPARFYRPRTK